MKPASIKEAQNGYNGENYITPRTLKKVLENFSPSNPGTSGGTDNYNELINLPQINGITLKGNSTLKTLGIQPAGDYASKSDIPSLDGYLTTQDASDTYQPKGDYQETLVSGTNIKTVNGISLLGSGDLPISGGESSSLDPLPINSILEYDGDTVPDGYEQVPDDDYIDKYSYEEFKTNKVWVDGRPIYRKVYSFSSITTLNIGTSNIADIVSSTCMLRQSNSGGHWRTLPWVWAEGTNFGGGEWSGGYFIRLDNYTIAFQVGSSLAAVDKGFLIMEYTKTTD